MRIIGGVHSGRTIKVPNDLPLRPTTDFAKEALFNILSNKYELQNKSVLDLFSGTGHISLEFASRGSSPVVSVDKNYKCVGFLRAIAAELKLQVHAQKSDVFEFLKNTGSTYDLIFADPPYDLKEIPEIHRLTMDRNLLKESGLLVIEHGAKTKLEALAGFTQHRKYGNVNFSFFER